MRKHFARGGVSFSMNSLLWRTRAVVLGVATILVAAGSVFAAGAIGNAPTVPSAPSIERPLAPAANDSPGPAPSAQHHWLAGHWRWFEGAYVWESGRWETPPAQNLVWHSPEWQAQGNGYGLREGYWDEASLPPRTVVTAPTAAPREIIVMSAPPPLQREVIYERPSSFHVWIGGHWGWHGNRHVWTSGRWSTPPRSNVVWVGPRWESRGTSFVFIDGYWRESVTIAPAPVLVASMPSAQVVVVAAPPPVRQEMIYASPGDGYLWIGGYWAWQSSRHVWIAGHYERPPRGYRSWVQPRWEKRGGSHIFIEGRWGR